MRSIKHHYTSFIQVISGAGHHVYADQAENFNSTVNKICDMADSNSFTKPPTSPLKTSTPTKDDSELNEALKKNTKGSTSIKQGKQELDKFDTEL